MKGDRIIQACSVSKDERCRLAGCPEWSPDGERNPKCRLCSGPVKWRGADGIEHGLARACTSCPMNGMGLKVCWICPGPSQDFATDGKKMVTLGSLVAADEFLSRNGRQTLDDGITGDIPAQERMMLHIIRRLMKLDVRDFDRFRDIVAGGDAAEAAKFLGVPTGAFRGENSPGRQIMERLGKLDGHMWRVVANLCNGAEQKHIAQITGVRTKQAVGGQLKRMMKAHDWVARIKKGIDDDRRRN